MKLVFRLAFTFLVVLSIFSCKNETGSEGAEGSSVVDSTQIKMQQEQKEKVLQSLLNKIISNPELKTFSSALLTGGLTDMLANEEGSYTVIAPNNGAFENVGREQLKPLFNQAQLPVLKALLENHIIPQVLNTQEMLQELQSKDSIQVATMGGATLTFYQKEGALIIHDENNVDAGILEADIKANNGSLMVINQVLNFN